MRPSDDAIAQINRQTEDVVLTFRFQRRGTVFFMSLNFYASETEAMDRLLVEYYAACYLLEDMPHIDSIDYARETLRRIESWLVQMDKGITGYCTPFGRQAHPGLAELYLMAISFPGGYIKRGNN